MQVGRVQLTLGSKGRGRGTMCVAVLRGGGGGIVNRARLKVIQSVPECGKWDLSGIMGDQIKRLVIKWRGVDRRC